MMKMYTEISTLQTKYMLMNSKHYAVHTGTYSAKLIKFMTLDSYRWTVLCF